MSKQTNDELREYLREMQIDVVERYSRLATDKTVCTLEELRAMFDNTGISLADEIVKERKASRF
ncbi:hypothetical protein [Paenibacillus sp. USHLN196]|uniref:hypothetical protein n=1 Tax=Paenibacillus sp. USHLN196 TaxID=3081291 RepID=UPI003016EBC5